jgi:hypothetical protein
MAVCTMPGFSAMQAPACTHRITNSTTPDIQEQPVPTRSSAGEEPQSVRIQIGRPQVPRKAEHGTAGHGVQIGLQLRVRMAGGGRGPRELSAWLPGALGGWLRDLLQAHDTQRAQGW